MIRMQLQAGMLVQQRNEPNGRSQGGADHHSPWYNSRRDLDGVAYPALVGPVVPISIAVPRMRGRSLPTDPASVSEASYDPATTCAHR